ncbi:SpaH/EbpB family LPXTG-anchored major pilin [Leucobacter ruminantium]|uniref:SpaH/EbpB family LPXTG-anchored major pilin n=1 Tax=Leucobacter ruminantium TaxID=1289170 RepID=A0A939LW24_9MICO|nr:SpaH/EbpB family LPXTG-anchored major pilin [Leucobacter ruminantium]MBO1805819.1 SpaH/EbpB family LPXTG-anchored major pilin [Leucobacter ruminantium]
MNSKSRAMRRIAAGVGAVALALVGVGTFSTAAFADVGPDQPGAPAEGTLTINKYAGAPLGEGETLEDRDTLDGVEFTVTPVGRLDNGDCVAIDLTDAADWDGLGDLFASAPAAPTAPFCLLTADAVSDVTAGGTVDFTLDVGVYFAQETDPGENHIVSKVPDFYVSIPTSEGDGGEGWNYDVVADPKNQIMNEPTKTIAEMPDGLTIGSGVTWTLTVPVPTLNNEETFTTASVSDVLDPRLSYASSSLTLDGAPLSEGPGGDYTVDPNGVTWTFTAAGRAKLDAAMGKSLSIELVTTVDEVGDGSIPNDEYSSTFNGTTVPGEQIPYTYWGQLSISKHDDSKPAKPLAGAEFQVFAEPQAGCPATAPATGAVATGTSNGSGTVVWEDVDPNTVLGLWVANSPNGPLADPSKDYCVYETVVPAGHTATAVSNPVTITPGEDGVFELDVVNKKKDGPDLPLTGAAGTLAMTIGGLAIIAAGAGAILVARRRQTGDPAD